MTEENIITESDTTVGPCRELTVAEFRNMLDDQFKRLSAKIDIAAELEFLDKLEQESGCALNLSRDYTVKIDPISINIRYIYPDNMLKTPLIDKIEVYTSVSVSDSTSGICTKLEPDGDKLDISSIPYSPQLIKLVHTVLKGLTELRQMIICKLCGPPQTVAI